MAGETLEKTMLDGKDKDELLVIAKSLGVPANARTAKATLIAKILEVTGVSAADAASAGGPASPGAVAPEAAAEPAPAASATSASHTAVDAAATAAAEVESAGADAGDDDDEGGPDGEGDVDDEGGDDGEGGAEGEGSSRRRRRRRRKNRSDVAVADRGDVGRERTEVPPEVLALEPVEVSGYLDLREEGYGFLRLHGYLSSRDDSYVPVKLARQYGLRKGDHITGLSRPPSRSERNPALLEVHTVNGADPDQARTRPEFDELTAVAPDEWLRCETVSDPGNTVARLVDLVAPFGKGERVLLAGAPRSGRSAALVSLVRALHHNHPDVELIVVAVDERPEEITELQRSLSVEVVTSSLDRPGDEHTLLAEMVIEKAKRIVEQGDDVIVVIDGLSRLGRAYNLTGQPTGRALAAGIDAVAVQPLKRLFGAGRNTEEAGSLTVVATVQVDTTSRVDEVIYDEVRGVATTEIRLDHALAEQRVYPALSVASSSGRYEDRVLPADTLAHVRALRRQVLAAEEFPRGVAAVELLLARAAGAVDNAALLASVDTSAV